MCGKNMRIPRGRKYVVSENNQRPPGHVPMTTPLVSLKKAGDQKTKAGGDILPAYIVDSPGGLPQNTLRFSCSLTSRWVFLGIAGGGEGGDEGGVASRIWCPNV